MAIGSYGTGVWIDNHVEDYVKPPFGGQRLAARALRDSRNDADDLADQVINSTMASTVYDVHQDNTWIRLAVDEEEGRIAVGTLDGQIIISEYA